MNLMLHGLLLGIVLTTSLDTSQNMSGTWKINVQSASAGTTTASWVLGQSGERVTGTYTGLFGTAPITGTLKGDRVDLIVETEVQSVPIRVTYAATLAGDTVKGSVTVEGYGAGSFTATREKSGSD